MPLELLRMLNIRKSIHPPHTTHIREFEPSDARGIVRLRTESAECFESMEINVLPPDLAINIVVRLANGNGIFPINFTV